MRFICCEIFFELWRHLFSGSNSEEMSEALFSSSVESSVRRCANIKSRKTPDVQCPYSASQGEFCSRHCKHPHRFQTKKEYGPETHYTRSNHAAASKIQKVWKRYSACLHLSQQGPGYFERSQSKNDTELYSLEPITNIPALYYFSLVDSKHCLWSFDIRSLGQLLSLGSLKENPYTREPFTDTILQKIRNRLTWLRTRKYTVFYPTGVELTQDQHWKQKILDLCMKLDSFGYYISCEWFHEMSIEDHQAFYKTLYDLWYHRLGLTMQDRDRIAPGHLSRANPLFRINPANFKDHLRHSKHWWEKLNAGVIEFLLTRGTDKEQQKLGAMYCVIGFVAINEQAAESFPWIVESF
jgi:hypothetical protein